MGFKSREHLRQRQNQVFKMRETVWITKDCCLKKTAVKVKFQ